RSAQELFSSERNPPEGHAGSRQVEPINALNGGRGDPFENPRLDFGELERGGRAVGSCYLRGDGGSPLDRYAVFSQRRPQRHDGAGLDAVLTELSGHAEV